MSPAATSDAPAGSLIEFTTPLHDDPNLDADDDEEGEHRYQKLANILSTDSVPGLACRDIAEAELHTVSVEEPKSLKEADNDPHWAAAMEEEMQSIRDNRTWSLAELPRGHRAIGLKWVYKVKRDENGASSSVRLVSSLRATYSKLVWTLMKSSCPSPGWSQCRCSLPSRRTPAGPSTAWT